MQHKIRMLISIIFLGYFSQINAHSLPFIANPISIKKNFLLNHLSGNVLDLSFSSLTDKDMPAIVDFLKKHREIISLNLAGNKKLTAAGIIPLAYIDSLTELNLARFSKDCKNNICEGGLEAKDILAFANNKNLKTLNLDMHSIGDEGAIALAKNIYLTHLDLSSNGISDIGGIALAHNTTLKALSLWSNNIGLETANAFAKNQTLQKLSLKQNNISDEGAVALAKNVSLISLNLAATHVTDVGTVALARNQTLKKLDLCWNHISLNGAVALATNKTLVSLSLCGDIFNRSAPRIGDEGASAFSHNTTLHKLELYNENLSATSVTELIKNPSLHHLGLGDNKQVGDEGAILLAQSDQLSELNLSNCNLTDKGGQVLAGMQHLQKLFVGFNFISDSGAEALSKNTSLSELNLIMNEIHDQGAIALAQNKTLFSLNVVENRITNIGNLALANNHYIPNIETGGTNPSPPAKNKIFNSLTISQTLASKGYCYRTTNAIQCIKIQ